MDLEESFFWGRFRMGGGLRVDLQNHLVGASIDIVLEVCRFGHTNILNKVTSSFLLLVRHLLLEAMHLFLVIAK